MCGNDEMRFSVFLIHGLAEKWNKKPKEVYELLNSTGILDEYIISCYDSLHTLGKEYLLEDITDFAREKGVRV